MSIYIHEEPTWPRFQWSREKLAEQLAVLHREQGRLLGRMEALGFKLRQEAVLETLTEDVLMSSEIEGEQLDAEQVRSSIARRLGMDKQRQTLQASPQRLVSPSIGCARIVRMATRLLT
jgi:Fic family protein